MRPLTNSDETTLTTLRGEFDRALRFHGPVFHEMLDTRCHWAR